MDSDVIRKRDPSKRRSIQVITLKRVEDFLKEQTEPVYKSEIVKKISVDYNSLNFALEMLPVFSDELGKVYIKKRGKNGASRL